MDYSKSCNDVLVKSITPIQPDPGAYVEISCYSDDYLGLKQINALRKNMQNNSKSNKEYYLYYLGLKSPKEFDVEDDGMEYLLKYNIIMTYIPESVVKSERIKFLKFEHSFNDTLDIKYQLLKIKNIQYFNYKNLNIDLNRKTLQKFINSVTKEREKNKYKNCIYILSTNRGIVKIIYNNSPDFFRFEIQ